MEFRIPLHAISYGINGIHDCRVVHVEGPSDIGKWGRGNLAGEIHGDLAGNKDGLLAGAFLHEVNEGHIERFRRHSVDAVWMNGRSGLLSALTLEGRVGHL